MSELLSLLRMARRAGVTQQWLREQADARAIPCLKAGRRYLFTPSVVMKSLAAMAADQACIMVEPGKTLKSDMTLDLAINVAAGMDAEKKGGAS